MTPKRIVAAFVVLHFALLCTGQNTRYQFGRIDMSKGLSNPIVNDIFQDSTGFIWFATGSGLNRYDGHSIKVFKNIPGDSTSLDVDNVMRIFEGPEGKLWIRSYYGTIVYNPKTENFDRNIQPFLKKYGVHEGKITNLKKDRQGRFWFMHEGAGLFCFNPKDNSTIRLFPDANDTTTVSTAKMSSITEDSKGNMWIILKVALLAAGLAFTALSANSANLSARADTASAQFVEAQPS